MFWDDFVIMFWDDYIIMFRDEFIIMFCYVLKSLYYNVLR